MPEFLIATLTAGNNPANWSKLGEILDGAEPDYAYKPFQEIIKLGDGSKKGRGYPSAQWSWHGISELDREVLRTFCAGLSADVYICTPTNETSGGDRVWINASATMNWMEADEEKNSDHTLDFQIEFTGMVAV